MCCDSTKVERQTGNSDGHAGVVSIPAYAFFSSNIESLFLGVLNEDCFLFLKKLNL